MEKRRENRIKKKLPIRFYFEGAVFHSFTGDMSRRGIFIATPHIYPPGKGINIEINGKTQKINLAGFIRWNKRDGSSPTLSMASGMGVQLLNYQKPEYQSLVSET